MATGTAYRAVSALYGWTTRALNVPRMETEHGAIPAGRRTPVEALNLYPGERVRIRSYAEILETTDANNKNRGMRFDPEMAPFCGGTFSVRRRVQRIVDEQRGYMIEMKTPAVILDGVICESRFSPKRLFCPRALPSFWREAWLERVDAPQQVKLVDRDERTQQRQQETQPEEQAQ